MIRSESKRSPIIYKYIYIYIYIGQKVKDHSGERWSNG